MGGDGARLDGHTLPIEVTALALGESNLRSWERETMKKHRYLAGASALALVVAMSMGAVNANPTLKNISKIKDNEGPVAIGSVDGLCRTRPLLRRAATCRRGTCSRVARA